ncbi:MAG TPA: FHA domain-containing protein, partial [Candidatus Tumulicola sp.]|nr:FHA domain-containing protein [Candidatus Tumulicola sp.]
ADELLADLMESRSTASAALDLTPTLTVVRNDRRDDATPAPEEARITILTGPHAGEATPMNKAQFVFGRPGVSVAAIRRSGGAYRLVPLAGESPPVVNGGAVDRTGADLAFGDTIEVAGVKLRFERRA